MLERIALHQTRLRAPGLGLDAKGVALGAKGLVLLPTLDRLVAMLAVYTRDHSLEDIAPSLEIHLVRSKLGTQEIAFVFAAESSDRMDRMAETARLVGGFTFTGTSRHFVEYRDAGAPFGYDASELLVTDAAFALYHERFTQTYDAIKVVDLRGLLLRLMLQIDPKSALSAGPRWIVAEKGLGPALIHYFVRSRVDGEVTVGQWPPASLFDEGTVQRYVFRIPELPPRMRPLLRATPGITTFLPVGPGVAVELGYRHPVSLRACPLFDPAGLVLLRGNGGEAWALDRLPLMGDLRAFARVELADDGLLSVAVSTLTFDPDPVRVSLRLVPSGSPWRNVTATWLRVDELPLLRRLAYALPRSSVARTRVAVTSRGAFLVCPDGIEAIPLGTFFVEIHPGLFIPAGYDVAPAVAPEVLYKALGAPASQMLFVTTEAKGVAVEKTDFVDLETLLIEAPPFEPLVADSIARALATTPVELTLSPLGAFPLRAAHAPTPAPVPAYGGPSVSPKGGRA
jgi:hypothetical protein